VFPLYQPMNASSPVPSNDQSVASITLPEFSRCRMVINFHSVKTARSESAKSTIATGKIAPATK